MPNQEQQSRPANLWRQLSAEWLSEDEARARTAPAGKSAERGPDERDRTGGELAA